MISALANLLPDWAIYHAPVLVVIVPLLLAPVCAALPSWRAAWALTLLAAVSSFIFALVLVGETRSGAVLSYALGGWEPPVGIEFRVDGLNAPVLLLVSFISVLATVFAFPSVAREIRLEKRTLFFAAFLICMSGLLGVGITGDAFNMFVFLELSSISTYVLVALGATQDRRALPAALNYLVMGTIGATFFVIGVGFLYAATGTLNMVDMALRLDGLGDSRTVQAGFAFIFVGLGLKAAMFPLHQWLPSAYAYAPSFVTVFLSATATKVAFYALVRMLFSVFSPDFNFQAVAFTWVLAPLGAIAAVTCSFQAFFQTDIRRMLAYSSVAQVGYMLLGLSMGTALGLSASLFHLANHAFMKGALFIAVAGVAMSVGSTRISDFAGAAKKAPLTMAGFAVGGLSLVGVPLTSGFLSKIALFNAALENGWWWAVAVLAVSSVLAVLYIGRILEAAYFREAPAGRVHSGEAPLLLLIPLWVLALTNLYIGIDASFVTSLTDAAAQIAYPGVAP